MSFEEKQEFVIDKTLETVVNARLKLAVFMQMTFVGVPYIYYGDEVGMQGLDDPFNHMPYTWQNIDDELLEFYKKMTALRNGVDCLLTGTFEVFYAKDMVLGYRRTIVGGEDVFGNKAKNGVALCSVNKGETEVCIDIDVSQYENTTPKSFFDNTELGAKLNIKGNSAEIYLG